MLSVFGVCPDPTTCAALYPTDSILRRDTTRTTVRNRAFFTELDHEIGAITFAAGIRQDHESQARDIDSLTSGDTPTAIGIVDVLHANGIAAPDGTQQLGTDYSALLPKLGVSYRFAPNWTTGFTAQRGYRTGGVNYSYQRGANAFAPEFTTNYDVSLKGLVADGTLLTMSAYRIDWRDQQVGVGSNSLDTYTVNAGRSRLHGLEVELRGKATKTVEVFGALGLSRTRFLAFVSPSGDFTGKQFAQSPRQTWSLGTTWKPGAFSVNADVIHESGTFSDPANTPSQSNPAHTLLNGKLSYAFASTMRVFVAGQNLLDDSYTIYRYANLPGRQVAELGCGRTLRAGLEAEF